MVSRDEIQRRFPHTCAGEFCAICRWELDKDNKARADRRQAAREHRRKKRTRR